MVTSAPFIVKQLVAPLSKGRWAPQATRGTLKKVQKLRLNGSCIVLTGFPSVGWFGPIIISESVVTCRHSVLPIYTV